MWFRKRPVAGLVGSSVMPAAPQHFEWLVRLVDGRCEVCLVDDGQVWVAKDCYGTRLSRYVLTVDPVGIVRAAEAILRERERRMVSRAARVAAAEDLAGQLGCKVVGS